MPLDCYCRQCGSMWGTDADGLEVRCACPLEVDVLSLEAFHVVPSVVAFPSRPVMQLEHGPCGHTWHYGSHDTVTLAMLLGLALEHECKAAG